MNVELVVPAVKFEKQYLQALREAEDESGA